ELANNCAQMQAAGRKGDTRLLDRLTDLVGQLQDGIDALEAMLAQPAPKTLHAEAEIACSEILPIMLAIRDCADQLEAIIADDMWPLPTYQEMLFIK
ncbi:MAG: glutamine synthetase type III, partial [Gemmatimonadetes bacterium]|nr:glutamine synthetase type III [Gemmatimonadota bacterium]